MSSALIQSRVVFLKNIFFTFTPVKTLPVCVKTHLRLQDSFRSQHQCPFSCINMSSSVFLKSRRKHSYSSAYSSVWVSLDATMCVSAWPPFRFFPCVWTQAWEFYAFFYLCLRVCGGGWGNKGDPLRGMLEMSGGDGLGKSATSLRGDPFSGSLPGCGDHKVSELLLQGLISARLVALCFFKSLVIFSSSEFGSRGLLYSSSSSLSELSFIFSVSESCFFLAEAISAACLFRHLVLLF